MSNLYLSRFLSAFVLLLLGRFISHSRRKKRFPYAQTKMSLMIKINKEIMRFKLMETVEAYNEKGLKW